MARNDGENDPQHNQGNRNGFDRDIVLVNDDGGAFYIQQSDLNKEPVDGRITVTIDVVGKETDRFKPIDRMLDQGVALAAIPTPRPRRPKNGEPAPEAAAFCYLINLSSLKYSRTRR